MTDESLYEVIETLIGPVEPTGDHGEDMDKRYPNLERLFYILDGLIDKVKNAGKYYKRPEFSMQHISNAANQYLTEIRNWINSIEYIPPVRFDEEDIEDVE